MSPAEIAVKLTRAQRAYLTNRAEWRKPAYWAQERWMSSPPKATLDIMVRRYGVLDYCGQITPLGLAVRAILKEQDNAE